MRRSSVGKGFHQKTEFTFDFIIIEIQQFENLILNVTSMNTDSASPYFNSVKGDVLSTGAYAFGLILSKCFKILQIGHGERMVA